MEARHKSGSAVDFEFRVLVEVKKSDAPWIVFLQEERWQNELFEKPHLANGLSITHEAIGYAVTDAPIHTTSVGHAINEEKREKDDNARWYVAATTVAKAAHGARNDKRGSDEEWSRQLDPLLFLTHPMVVLEGDLFSARIDQKGETQIEQLPFVSMRLEFGTEAYEYETYRIDLVTVTALGNYLGLLEKRVKELERAAERASAPKR